MRQDSRPHRPVDTQIDCEIIIADACTHIDATANVTPNLVKHQLTLDARRTRGHDPSPSDDHLDA
jgi:hypothetical protein